MAYGVTAAGFVDKPIEVILSEIEADQKADLGATFDVSVQSPAGQFNGVMVTQLRELWEVAQAVYSSIDPDSAIGVALAALSAFSGTVKAAATKSTVTATVNLNAGVTLAAGAVASVSGAPASRFITLADATNSGGAPAGISVAMEAETAGVVVANAGTLTEIDTPSSGWNSVTNAADADIGEEAEEDEDLRVRRETELSRAGKGNVDAIEADIDAVTGVTSVTAFENTGDVADGDGIPAHAFEPVVLGGAANAVAQAIWDSQPAGIEAHGDTSGTAVDTDGENQTVEYTIPTEIRIYVDVEVTVDADYPADGDAQIKAAIAAWSQANLGAGDDVVVSQINRPVETISGIVDITLVEIDIVTPPVGTSNIAITDRQIADIDTADVRVTST